ncbi:AAA domain-containing protein [Actinopolyspora xinjiangensis]|uniref:AAA domain-containing protein n=1 Tax=Actinopolyspora xinjiangensis TaxID=405564 RepID=A0A1H0PDS0_9ACTN|nr:AAA family ATPase [Actinopolyspora xinjiangensis]SDP03154.1 AAA domain-containing protein [Actinopolyspora xinjiangensis]
MTVEFSRPDPPAADRVHHDRAAVGNAVVADEAVGVLRGALSGTAPVDRLLLRAAAGAGKSFVLKRLVADAVEHPACSRVAVIAFTNKQVHPLAASLGGMLGRERVCLFVGSGREEEVPEDARSNSTPVTSASGIPPECRVVVSTCHKLGAPGELDRLGEHLGAGHNGDAVFDVLFVDEAWQLPHHLFDRVVGAAPITVGVGDVGQLPPLEAGANPWRGDPGFNPYRAWPTDFESDERTWSVELPAVWRPAAGHLDLWRAFYPQWGELNCVAGPGDRALVAEGLAGEAAEVWRQVGTGVPTLLEVAGLPDPEAADVDLPLLRTAESMLDALFASGFVLEHAEYDDKGAPTGSTGTARPGDGSGEPLVAVLATRNQAVDDATEIAERLRARYSLHETEVVASTVDSWQGQTNRLTVAIHPLSGASRLDEFNSAFGRLAVTCTRATHGLLMLTRPGIDELLDQAPARPGTPLGEPGNRHLPRQTHQRILATFARGTLTVEGD